MTTKHANVNEVRKKKGQLPTKICPVCSRPFEWRKKWERDWESVTYCSERCRKNRRAEDSK
jgi:hypothetical protein